MFIETHSDNNTTLTFVKSANIQAYPCGRRQSEAVDRDGNPGTVNDRYYFPFDPEARLNTEANNRKHSSLNGYTQTYLKSWDETDGNISLALGGYWFNIKLDAGYITANDFSTKVLEQIDDANATTIYANILTEDVHLFSGFQEYYTSVLRNQSNTSIPETTLDLINTTTADSGNLESMRNFANYYFSGLSFSTTPLTGDTTFKTRNSINKTFTRDYKTVKQQIVSLCILKKVNETWVINEPAWLPEIEHGETPNSIKVEDVVAHDITANHVESPTLFANKIGTDSAGSIKRIEDIYAEDIDSTAATIETVNATSINGTNATIETINATKTVQSIKFEQLIDDTLRPVPAIFVQPIKHADDSMEYQLQLYRTAPLVTKNEN